MAEVHSSGSFCMGGKTYCVEMTLFAKNRRRLIQHIKVHPDYQEHSLIFMKGGQSTTLYSSNTEVVFRQESYFNWCFGVLEPNFYGAIEVDTGRSMLFVPCPSPEQRYREVEVFPPGHYTEKYGVQDCSFVDEIDTVLKMIQPSQILILKGIDKQSNLPMLEPEPALLEGFEVNQTMLHPVITELRVVKTLDEIDLLRYICNVSCNAHKEVMRRIRPDWYEYQAESLFKHIAYSFGGCRNTAYICKAQSGAVSAATEYGNSATPNDKKIAEEEICVFDMGAEYYCYSSVVTCSFPVSGKFSLNQKNIYRAVLMAHKAVLEQMKPGVAWIDMHMLAERIILKELLHLKVVMGNIDDLVINRVAALFMPHGLGHFVGLDPQDVGGFTENTPPKRSETGLDTLHTMRVLRGGMVITVGPACYFNLKILDKALRDPRISKYLNEQRISEFFLFGGVRIEDTVLITGDGVEVLTKKMPREIHDIEVLMAEGQRMDHASSLLPTPKRKRFHRDVAMLELKHENS